MNVVIVGNCQVNPAATMLSQCYPEWNIINWIVWLAETKLSETQYKRSIQSADIIIAHPVQDGYGDVDWLSTNWLKQNKCSSADLVMINHLRFDGQQTGLVGLVMDGIASNFYNQPYHDMGIIHAFIETGNTEKAHEYIFDKDGAFSEKAFNKYAEISLAELKRREYDDTIDVVISDYIESGWRDVGLFHATSHPCRHLLKEQIDRVLGRLGYPRLINDYGDDHFEFIHFPANKIIQNNISWSIKDADQVKFPDRTFSAYDYEKEYLMYLHSIGLERLSTALSMNSTYKSFVECIPK